jgi:hypothetical protein
MIQGNTGVVQTYTNLQTLAAYVRELFFFPSARSMCEDNTNKGGIAQDGSRMAQIVKMNIPRNCALSRDPKHISLELQRRVTGQVQKLVA